MNQVANFQKDNIGHLRSLSIPRWSALIGGGTLAVFGITRRSKAGIAAAAAGGALAFAGARARRQAKEQVSRSNIIVNCSTAEAYRFWRDFENLPRFMHHLEAVTKSGDGQSRWTARGPMGSRIHWNAEVVDDRNERIAWRSLPGSDLSVDGSVEFRTAPGERGTLVTATMRYSSSGGGIGHAFAKLLAKNSNFQMEQDLRRFKALIETGEIATIEGQTHGPRSFVAGAARLADPDRPPRHGSILKTLRAERRAS